MNIKNAVVVAVLFGFGGLAIGQSQQQSQQRSQKSSQSSQSSSHSSSQSSSHSSSSFFRSFMFDQNSDFARDSDHSADGRGVTVRATDRNSDSSRNADSMRFGVRVASFGEQIRGGFEIVSGTADERNENADGLRLILPQVIRAVYAPDRLLLIGRSELISNRGDQIHRLSGFAEVQISKFLDANGERAGTVSVKFYQGEHRESLSNKPTWQYVGRIVSGEIAIR